MTPTGGPTVDSTPGGSERFIEEGAKSYVQATIAMKEFARIVQDACEKAALDRLDDINRVMGTKLSDDDLHRFPRGGRLVDPTDPWLCVYFSVGDIGYLNLGLYWQPLKDGGYKLHGVATFHILDKKLFERARERFKGLKNSRISTFPFGDQSGYLTLLEPIPAGQAASFLQMVDSVLSSFLEDWERIGGLSGLTSPSP
jgi:hypothetical protein